MRNLGSNGQKSRVQNVLILLVESGLVYLGFQVSHFCILLAHMCAQILTIPTDSVLGFGSTGHFFELQRPGV